MRFLVAFGRFWWDFIVGDDWRIAAGVLAVLGLGAVLVGTTELSDSAISLLIGAGLVVAAAITTVHGARRARGHD